MVFWPTFRKVAVIFFLVFLAGSVIGLAAQNSFQFPFKISYKTWHPGDFFMLMGEITNLTDKPWTDIKLRVVLLNNNLPVKEIETSPALPYLPPNGKIPFQEVIPPNFPSYSSVKVIVDSYKEYKSLLGFHPWLWAKVVKTRSAKDEYGFVHVYGEVYSSGFWGPINVACTFYNADNEVIGVSNRVFKRKDFQPITQWFDFPYYWLFSSVAYYSVQAQGDLRAFAKSWKSP